MVCCVALGRRTGHDLEIGTIYSSSRRIHTVSTLHVRGGGGRRDNETILKNNPHMQPSHHQRAALCATAAALGLAFVYVYRRSRRAGGSPLLTATLSDGTSLTLRSAHEDDLPHLESLSAEAGQNIVPGGGDFIVREWPSWWRMHPNLHENVLAFAGSVSAAFARIELYGPVDSPHSAWLEGLRIKPDFQGKGIMGHLLRHLFSLLTSELRSNILLAVGSTNERMVQICNRLQYEYVGAFCLHRFLPGAPPASRARYDAFSISVKKLCLTATPAECEAGWEFLRSHPLHEAEKRLLLPGRFYAFQALTRAALDDKIESGRAYIVLQTSSPTAEPCAVGVFFTFDTSFDASCADGIHTCVFSPQLEAGAVGSALGAFANTQPTRDATTGKSVSTLIAVGPYLNNLPDSRGDVEPTVMVKALAAANYTRMRGTHLKVFRVPKVQG